MDLDRPHFRTTSTGSSSATTSELFICFTSRLSSSSSMKLSKSILSPGRAARDGGPASLSSSLSRRLRSNGSLKGGQASPFFTTPGKKRGCAFENPEPSSPKVTCIGQVRVKTKKKVKQSRSLSKRRSGEVSFRKIEQTSAADIGGQQSEDKVCNQTQQQKHSNASAHFQQPPPPPAQECLPHRNQRWVHLPISICEALRAFGAEFSCLFPCKSSCFSTSERDQKAEKHSGNENGCGAVFARWLVSVNDDEGGKRREIELVVGDGDEEEEETAERRSMRSSRRHVFEDIEVKDDRIELKGQSVEGEEEAARVSICIPPKNALLLMRCRSDPMKMAALANRFSWDAHAAPRNEDEDIEEENKVEENVVAEEHVCEGKEQVFERDEEAAVSGEPNEEQEIPDHEAEANLETEEVGELCHHEEETQEEGLVISSEEKDEERAEELQQEIVGTEGTLVEDEDEGKEEVESNMSSFEALLDQENTEHYEDCPTHDKEEVEGIPMCHLSPSTESDEESDEAPPLPGEAATESEKEAIEESSTAEKDTTLIDDDEGNQGIPQPQPEPETIPREDDGEEQEEQRAASPTRSQGENTKTEESVASNDNEEPKREKEGQKVLPECLLLMMCEPKLSMEVSKETWVCSTDFIRWLPERPRKPAKATKGGGCDHEPVKRRLSIDSKPKPAGESNEQQPPRSSCSLPGAAAAASMATMIEQKLVNAVGYEPFVLTRCKSEPMRTAAAKLMPESCFWKNAMRKLEPHRRATLGVGAAGVGF